MQPLCFVIMPFGSKKDPSGGPDINFDLIYNRAIEPAIKDADMVPIRADEEKTGGIIHKPMFERLLLCDYAIADLTTANANVFYELGVRHTARPHTTMTIFANQQQIPFDTNYLRSLPYDLGKNNSFSDAHAESLKQQITDQLQTLKQQTKEHAAVDSPIFQLLDQWQPAEIAHLKTDVFAERVQANEDLKQQLATIRSKAKNDKTAANKALTQFRQQLGNIDAVEAGTVIDLLLTYRALEDHQGMITLYDQMPKTLKNQILVREQLGFAYNRRADSTNTPEDRDQALAILQAVVEQQGANSETNGLIGRIYKDKWQQALENGQTMLAEGFLQQAIEQYQQGFFADQRDAYPGINMLTLMDIEGSKENLEQKDKLLPVVLFAVEQRLNGKPNYWDYATMLELAILTNDDEKIHKQLTQTLMSYEEAWQLATTADNLTFICQAKQQNAQDTAKLEQVISQLRALQKKGRAN